MKLMLLAQAYGNDAYGVSEYGNNIPGAVIDALPNTGPELFNAAMAIVLTAAGILMFRRTFVKNRR